MRFVFMLRVRVGEVREEIAAWWLLKGSGFHSRQVSAFVPIEQGKKHLQKLGQKVAEVALLSVLLIINLSSPLPGAGEHLCCTAGEVAVPS